MVLLSSAIITASPLKIYENCFQKQLTYIAMLVMGEIYTKIY
jgi:hypothetical protein